MDGFKRMEENKIIPVAVIEDAANAIPLGNALLDAGLNVIEVTFRTAAAKKSISLLRKELPDMLVGAGTVLKIEHVDAAVESGAQFMVTPGYNPTIVDYCIKNNYQIAPGLNSPSMVEWGLEKGLTHFKLFPADLSGGPKMLRLLLGPYPTARFMPTGGVNNETLVEYLKIPNVFACGGSWIVKEDLISSKNFEEITHLTKAAVEIVKKEIK